jgi:hypothetical protein
VHLGVRACVCAWKAGRAPAGGIRTWGHRERFIFSGLSNRRGRYVHALAAINDLISVSFHLEDYGRGGSGEGIGQRREGKEWEGRERESARGVVFQRGSRLIIAFSPGLRPGAAAICRSRVTQRVEKNVINFSVARMRERSHPGRNGQGPQRREIAVEENGREQNIRDLIRAAESSAAGGIFVRRGAASFPRETVIDVNLVPTSE